MAFKSLDLEHMHARYWIFARAGMIRINAMPGA
jgi:hypothetical protein